MVNETIKIDQSVKDWFKLKHPGIKVKEPRFATLGVAEEYKRMEVGDVVLFPASDYPANTVRCTPNTTLLNKVLEGCKWTTRVDPANKSIAVLRLS